MSDAQIPSNRVQHAHTGARRTSLPNVKPRMEGVCLAFTTAEVASASQYCALRHMHACHMAARQLGLQLTGK